MKIEIRNLTVTRPGAILVFQDFNATFDSTAAGAFALLGANGAGKSTLFETILGLVPFQGGSIKIDDEELLSRNLPTIRKKIGMIFQNSDHQLFSQTVREDIAFGPSNLDLSPEEIARRVNDSLNRFGLTSLADRDVGHLSGGEKRRAALAGVLAMHPQAILLDEPTSMLDPRSSRELAEYLNTLPALKLIATHDLAFAEKTCPYALLLKDGKVFAQGETSRILQDHSLLRECGLE